eukprot:scaffold27545_cov35-Attheya_sp.AAC.1
MLNISYCVPLGLARSMHYRTNHQDQLKMNVKVRWEGCTWNGDIKEDRKGGYNNKKQDFAPTAPQNIQIQCTWNGDIKEDRK